MDNVKNKKKKKIRFKGILVVVLGIYLLGSLAYYILSMPIKSIDFLGNTYLKDNYLREYLDIKDKPIIKISKKDVKKKLTELDLVKDVKISKIYPFKLKIEITEEEIFFYNNNTSKVVLESGEEVPFNNNYLGVPTLINYTPEEIYKDFIKYFKRIDPSVRSLISEIEYSQSVVSGKVVDDKRFLFRMNDGNIVYINTINIEKFNDYLEVYEAIVNKNGNKIGCLYLDSNSDDIYFDDCNETVKKELENEGNS